MKILKGATIGLVCMTALFFATTFIALAQTNAPDSIVQLTAESQGLQLMTPDELPTSGTFWVVDSYGLTMPWPCPPTDTHMPVYQITDDPNQIFLVDGTGGQVSVRHPHSQEATSDMITAALESTATNIVALINSVQDTEFTRSFAMAMGMDVPSPGDGGGGTNDYAPNGFGFAIPDYGTNLWIAQTVVSNGWLNAIGSNTISDVLYEVQSCTNLAQIPTGWQSEEFFDGSELTNWTAFSVAQNGRPILFLQLRSWADDTGTGIPDWWWLQYFGQITNVDAYASAAGDGYSNFQKFQMGINPTVYYNPNPVPGFFGTLDLTDTNVVIVWSNAPGPVVNYAIERGVSNIITGEYDYTTTLVSSNATMFKDIGAYNSTNALYDVYNLYAIYPGGSVTATDTWQINWYVGYTVSTPPYGPPMPGNVYAYAAATSTNVLLSWTPAFSGETNYVVYRGVFNTNAQDYVYTQIGSFGTNVTSMTDIGALTNLNSWSDIYEVEAIFPGGYGSSLASTLGDWSDVSINPGANINAFIGPTNFFGYTDTTGTNVYLNWSMEPGAVTNYLIYGSIYDPNTGLIECKLLARLNTNTTSFESIGAIDSYGNPVFAGGYYVVAVFANGSLSQSTPWAVGNSSATPAPMTAYVDTTGTNVDVEWTPVPNAINYVIQWSGDDGDDYFPLATVSSNSTSYEDVGGVGYAYDGLDNVIYQVQANIAGGGSAGASTGIASAPPTPAPTSLTAIVDPTGTNVVLTWFSPASLAASLTGYTIFRGTYNPSTGQYTYSQIGTTSAGVTSFEDAGAITSGNANNNIYKVEANYSAGGFSMPIMTTMTVPSSSPTSNAGVSAQMVRNQTGRWQLMFSSIPTNVQTIAFYWYYWDYFYDIGPFADTVDLINGQPITTENDIPVSSITNGVYVLPDFLTTNWFPDNGFGKVAVIQPIGTDNQYGRLIQVGFQPYDSPTFVDARQHLMQNLFYQLRSATISQPNAPLSENNVWNDPFFQSITIPLDTNYVESSIFHWSEMFKGYNDAIPQYTKMDDVWPITANYELHNNLYDTNFSGTQFQWQPNTGNLLFQGSLATIPAPAVLAIGDPYWTYQGLQYTNVIDPDTGLAVSVLEPGPLADLAAYVSGGNLYLESGVNNLFGLAFQKALVNTGGWEINPATGLPTLTPIVTLPLGGSVALTNINNFYSQTVDPELQLVNYYFAPVNTPGTALVGASGPSQPYPLPCQLGFANTNQTGLLVASVGQPAVIGGWSRFSIENGSSSKYAYLGQYFNTNAFVLTNGVITTNTTGVVSPYGDFFPTQAGAVAMITMPDYDNDPPGTGIVRVISLNVDANHDGTMDFAYGGPDFVSSGKPFRFWANDDQDAGDDGGNGGIPGLSAQQQSDGYNYQELDYNGNPLYRIHGTRDLVDFFPVYLNIGSLFQSNALSAGISATDTNWQFVLSQADGILRFAFTSLTPTNYMNFLDDTNEARLLGGYPGETGNYAGAQLTTVSSTGVALSPSFVAGIATNNQGIILVEAATNTTQPLVLTIFHGTNQIAQTSLPLSVTGVEQMFRSKTMLLYPQTGSVPDRLTDADVPNEPDTTDVNFIFLHGYNVNPDQARGWNADIYKRLYWSGSHAKFYGVTWTAADSQVANAVTINLQTNIVHAFATAPLLNSFLNGLSGNNVIAGHSLGNMLILSTLNDCSNQTVSAYMMIDAAVAIEAIDKGASINADMYNSPWSNYQTNLWASRWSTLWPTNDYRNQLSWSGRLANLQNTAVYNFYSSGEEVLRDYPGSPPSGLFSVLEGQVEAIWNGATGEYTWAWQEKCKGLMAFNNILSSNHGGWGFNENNPEYYWHTNGGDGGQEVVHLDPSSAALLPTTQLQTNAFFDMSYDSALFTSSSSGSTYAQANRNRILSDAIPCLTLPIGANPVIDPGIVEQNTDMKTLENSWPAARMEQTETNNWHHSDVRAVAYTFTHQLFDNITTVGNLK